MGKMVKFCIQYMKKEVVLSMRPPGIDFLFVCSAQYGVFGVH